MSRRLLRWTLVAAAILIVFFIVLWRSTHPVALLLKYRIHNWLAGKPDIHLAFQRNPEDRPTLAAGTRDTPMLVMDSCILADAEGLHLFYSTVFIPTDSGLTQFWNPRLGEQFDISQLTTGLAYAFSNDQGLTWSIREQPLLLPSVEGWDDYRVETASAIVREHTLHVFYCADSTQSIGRYQIGEVSTPLQQQSIRETLLTAEEPLTRERDTPVLAADFERSCFHNNLQEPSVILRDRIFELFFVGLQMSEPGQPLAGPGQQLQRIGMGRALLGDSLALQEITPEPVLEFANIVEVRQTQQGLIAFVTLPGTGDAHQGERIGYHTSQDGLHWSQSATVLTPRAEGFDNWACMSPTALFRDDRWILFYTALQHDTQRDDVRWGMSLGKDSWLFGTLGRAESNINPASPVAAR